MAKSKIEWTAGDDGSLGETWNPTTGCTRISPGCKECYAFQLHDMRHAAHKAGKRLPLQYAKPFSELQLMPERLKLPLGWKKPRRIFVNSMSDLFHDDVPDEFIDRVFATMALCPQHTFQILTKRAGRMRAYFAETVDDPDQMFMRWGAAAGELLDGPWVWGAGKRFRPAIEKFIGDAHGFADLEDSDCPEWPQQLFWPLPNVWLGVSVESQPYANRIGELVHTPAAVRFVSYEPALGPVDFRRIALGNGYELNALKGQLRGTITRDIIPCAPIGWLIAGGESGPGSRNCCIDWIRAAVKQCKEVGVPVFVKQLGSRPVEEFPLLHDAAQDGEYPPFEHLHLADKKGGDPEEWPEDLRVRQFPEVGKS